MKTLILFFILALVSGNLWAAGDTHPIYWIQFSDKNNTLFRVSEPSAYLSQRAIERRNNKGIAIDSTDLPVNRAYCDSLASRGFALKHTSRWLNGAIATLPDSIKPDSLVKPSFVTSIECIRSIPQKSASAKLENTDSLNALAYGNSYIQLSMMNGQLLHTLSKGAGVHIAVIDAGFWVADTLSAFDSLRSRNGILGTYDFVNPGGNVYTQNSHGTAVLSTMAAHVPGKILGTAPEASYWLLRTEDVYGEYPAEEYYWIVAAEFADSAGCDLINTSLGYTTFDDASFNHTYEELNGNTLLISKAANMAVEKGMVVVCSAGNDGSKAWKYISAPSEATKVLSIAAVDASRNIAGFSSHGFGLPEKPQKPDIAAMGVSSVLVASDGTVSTGSGTSFSSPIVAGLIACVVALKPNTPSIEISDWVRQSANRYPAHDTLYGYGIPDFGNIIEKYLSSNPINKPAEKLVAFPIPFRNSLRFKPMKESGSLEIFDTKGTRMVKLELKENTGFQLPAPLLENLSKGVYIARWNSKHSQQTIQLIKY